MWEVCPAGLTRRAQRATKIHEGLPVCLEITKDTKDTKKGCAGGGPCVRARRTSGPGACRAWRASHATLWGRGADAPWQRKDRSGDSGDAGDTGAPASGRRRAAGTWGGAPPRTAISQSAHKEMQARAPGERAMDRPPLYPSPVGAFCSPFSVLRSLGRPCRPIQSANQAR